jgi:DNA-3-methyladenine glycosylase
VINGQRISGIINETEAYDGEQDQACHAKSGKTARNYVMYGRPGRAYVYFTYGIALDAKLFCGPEGYPAAVLIRSLIPDEGLDFIACKRQGISQRDWCSGPARLTRALAIGRECNEVDLTGTSGGLFIEESNSITEDRIHRTPRIGIQYAGEPWVNMPWRFVLQEST